MQHHEGDEEHGGSQGHAEQVTHLHAPGRAAQDVPGLEVLQHLTGHGRTHADHSGHAQHGGHALAALHTQHHHHEGGDHQGRQREARDRVVAGAHDAHQVAADGREEEAQDHHHQGRHEGDQRAHLEDAPSDEEGHQGREAQAEHDVGEGQVLVDAVHHLLTGSSLLHVRHGAAEARGEALAHFEEGEAGAHEHAADGDGPHDELPDRDGEGDPVALRGILGQDAGRQEIGDDGHQQAPGDDAAGEVQGAEFGPDDVAHAHVGGADAGGAEQHAAADLGLPAVDEVDGRGLEAHEPFPGGGEELDLHQGLDHSADAHGAEEELGAAAPTGAGLVDLGGGHALGVREFRILHHDAAEQGHEHDAQHAAGEHDQRTGDVVAHGEELRPDAADDEGGDGEDGAGGHGLADAAHGAGHVLFEDGALHELDEGHPDDRRGVGGGDGHAGLQPEVGIGGAEHHGHDEADEHRPQGELPHVLVGGDKGLHRCS